jgi:hypothetical protein
VGKKLGVFGVDGGSVGLEIARPGHKTEADKTGQVRPKPSPVPASTNYSLRGASRGGGREREILVNHTQVLEQRNATQRSGFRFFDCSACLCRLVSRLIQHPLPTWILQPLLGTSPGSSELASGLPQWQHLCP